MKEDDSNWFPKWEDDLPLPEDLTPLSQTLITPHLATAFDIPTPTNHHHPPSLHHRQEPPISTPNSPELCATTGGDEPARTLKRPRLVWTPQLHKRFVDAVAHLGIKNAVPKTIMQLMSVDGLTRENVASHLQKYRLYLKRMQGLSSSGSAGDPATDCLFASSPVPAHFLHQGRPNSDQFLPYVPVGVVQQQQHQQQQMAQLQPRYGQFGSPRNGQFEHSFVNRQNQQGVHRVGAPVHNSVASSYVDDLESASGRKVLTLFPTGGD